MTKFTTFMFCITALLSIPVQTKPKSRIIGGNPARAGQFPFIAAIHIATNSGTYFCSGTLINNQWVLTAGQCVDGALLLTIRLGSNSLEGNDPNALRLATDTYTLHPEYNPDTLDNDIAVIKFRLPITFTDYIKPVDFLANFTLNVGSAGTIAGWGQTSDESAGLVDELNYVIVTTLSNEECRIFFGSQITDNMVCVDGNYNEGTCKGDSGSPLVQRGRRGNLYHVGISSFVSGNGCESPDPSGFTRTSVYREWIKNVTGV